MVDFTNGNWSLVDDKGRLTIKPEEIIWSNVRREFVTHISKKTEEINFKNFTHRFDFIVTELITFLRSNRLLLSLWKLKKSEGNVVSVYIDKTREHADKFRIVFYQRVNGNNEFVSVSDYLDVNHKYRIIIRKNKDKFFMQILWEEKSIFKSDEQKGVDHTYNEIIFAQSHGFVIEPKDESSGILNNIELTEAPIEDERITNPIDLFTELITHSRIKQISSGLFGDGYYDDSVLKTYIEIELMVKEKALFPKDNKGAELSGSPLMHRVFDENNPILRINELAKQIDLDEQKGYCKIYAGAMEGIRNPNAHGNEPMEPDEAIRLLCLANLLAEKVDHAEYTG